MRSILLTILLGVSFFASSQSWCPPGAHWTYDISSIGGGGFAHYKLDKDTIIAGVNCKKLLGYQEIQSTNPGPPYAYYTYERNDTVFFLVNKSTGKFAPTYYFNAKLGDTIGMPLLNKPCGTVLKVVVDSVSTITVQGKNLRYYRATFNNGTNTPTSIHVVERFGAIHQHIIPFAYCEGFATDIGSFLFILGCYQDNTISEHQVNPNITCQYYFPLGIAKNDALAGSVTLLPNPASFSVSINTAGNIIKQYEVLNIAGQTLVNNTSGSGNFTIDISAFPPGLYLLKLQLLNGQYTLKRFVKE